MALTDDARTLEFQVTGMTCAGCAANVQRAIERLPGIRDATVSLDAALARVAGADLDPDAIVRAIEGRGFGATPVTHRPDAGSRRSAIEARQHAQAAAWKRRAIIGIGLWIPLEALHWLAPHGSWMGWVMLVGSTIVLLAAGGGFFRSALAAARRATTNMDTLISIGAFT
ncbi:MAG: cation-translocating P-type ATPase, partial [Phycisphaerales bacterium]|nr:cation-translocating P-type ATPase [Phycisphaerales bacterium]